MKHLNRPFSHFDHSQDSMQAGAWISLFAMILIYLAPLVSQAQMTSHHVSMSSIEIDERAFCDVLPTDIPQPPKVHVHELEAACGYCTLLFHLNWLNVAEFKLPKLTTQPEMRITAQTQRSKSVPIYSSVNPRAPPRNSLFTNV